MDAPARYPGHPPANVGPVMVAVTHEPQPHNPLVRVPDPTEVPATATPKVSVPQIAKRDTVASMRVTTAPVGNPSA